MTAECGVHPFIQLTERQRIETDEFRRELGDTRSRAGRVGGQVRRTKRADLSPSSHAVVCLDGYDGRIEH
jgi:hypothetical protein